MTTEPMFTPPMQPMSGASTAAGHISRRALITTAGLGACAAGVVATPVALKYAEDLAAQAAKNALEAGIEQGREAVLAELAQLEGITIESAIGVAELTKLGIQYVAAPLAQFVATIAGDGLSVLVGAVSNARDWAARFGFHNDQVDGMITVMKSWQTNLAQAPDLLSKTATADVNGAETYLKQLKQMIDSSKNGSASPTATP
jgi:hypothetical protein